MCGWEEPTSEKHVVVSGSQLHCGPASLYSDGASMSQSLMGCPAPSPGGVITPQSKMPSMSSAPSPVSHYFLSSSLWCPSVRLSTRCPASPTSSLQEASATTCDILKNNSRWWAKFDSNKLWGVFVSFIFLEFMCSIFVTPFWQWDMLRSCCGSYHCLHHCYDCPPALENWTLLKCVTTDASISAITILPSYPSMYHWKCSYHPCLSRLIW